MAGFPFDMWNVISMQGFVGKKQKRCWSWNKPTPTEKEEISIIKSFWYDKIPHKSQFVESGKMSGCFFMAQNCSPVFETIKGIANTWHSDHSLPFPLIKCSFSSCSTLLNHAKSQKS